MDGTSAARYSAGVSRPPDNTVNLTEISNIVSLTIVLIVHCYDNQLCIELVN